MILLLIPFAICVFCETTNKAVVERTVYGKVGETAKLTCPHFSTEGITRWKGPPDYTVYTSNSRMSQLLSHSNRVMVTGNFSQGEYNLEISNFTKSDAGDYRWVSTVDGNIVHHDYALIAYKQPSHMSIENSTEEQHLKVYEEIPTTLVCTVVSGVPAESMMWLSGDQVLSNGGPSRVEFSLIPKKSDHLKVYTCYAYNSQDDIISLQTTLIVKSRPKICIERNISTELEAGQTLKLVCRVTANEQCLIQWKRGWNNSRQTIKNCSQDFNTSRISRCNLNIPNVNKEHSGLYECEAGCNMAVTSDQIYIAIKYRPCLISDKTLFKTETDRAVNITLLVDSYGPPEVSWLSVRGGKLGIWTVKPITIMTGRNNTFKLFNTIVPLQHSHFGNYSLRIRNGVGKLDVNVTIDYLYWHIKMAPKCIVINTSASVNLTCNVNLRHYKAWTVTVEHVWDSQFIRTLGPPTTSYMSSFTLPYIDYRDTGIYTCLLKTSDAVFKDQAVLVVQGPPIILSMDSLSSSSVIRADVTVFSTPQFTDLKWLTSKNGSEKMIQIDGTNAIEHVDTCLVNITTYGVRVLVNGTKITLTYYAVPASMMLTFRIQNLFGTAEKTLELESWNKKQKESSSFPGPYHTAMYIIVAFAILVVIVMTVCVYIHVKKRRIRKMDVPVENSNDAAIALRSTNDAISISSRQQSFSYEDIECLSIYEENIIQTTNTEPKYLEILGHYENLDKRDSKSFGYTKFPRTTNTEKTMNRLRRFHSAGTILTGTKDQNENIKLRISV